MGDIKTGEKQVKQYILSEDLGQAVLNYLVAKPYQDVFKLVEGLSKIPEHKPEVPKLEVTPEVQDGEAVK